jgi:hypothetical protein
MMDGPLEKQLSRTGRLILNGPTIVVAVLLGIDWMWHLGTREGVVSSVAIQLHIPSKQIVFMLLLLATFGVCAAAAFAWDAITGQGPGKESEVPKAQLKLQSPRPSSTPAEVMQAVQKAVAERLRRGETRETIRADFVSRGFPGPAIDQVLASFRGEWRSGPLSWSIQLLGLAVFAAGLAVIAGPAEWFAGHPELIWLKLNPRVAIPIVLSGIAIFLVGWLGILKTHRASISRKSQRLCANCGAFVFLGRRRNGKRFCDDICVENALYPGVMCPTCVADTTDEGPGELRRINGTGYWLTAPLPLSKCGVCYSAIQSKVYYTMHMAGRSQGDFRIKWRKRNEYAMARRLRRPESLNERIEPR